MIRRRIVHSLRENTPSNYWNSIWWMPSLLAIVLLPVGVLFFESISLFGLAEPRVEQLLMILSIFYGLIIGTGTLLLAGEAKLSSKLMTRVKWLARFAIITPLLSLLILFWIFSRP